MASPPDSDARHGFPLLPSPCQLFVEIGGLQDHSHAASNGYRNG
jgi:hypothetical protein